MAANDKDLVKLAKNGFDLFNKGDFDGLRNLFADNVTLTDMTSGQTIKGSAAVVDWYRSFKTAFPDMKVDIKRQIACGNLTVSEFVCRGTHKGVLVTPMGDIAPTDRKIETAVCELDLWQNGKIVEVRGYSDNAALMSQLGVGIPEAHRV